MIWKGTQEKDNTGKKKNKFWVCVSGGGGSVKHAYLLFPELSGHTQNVSGYVQGQEKGLERGGRS